MDVVWVMKNFVTFVIAAAAALLVLVGCGRPTPCEVQLMTKECLDAGYSVELITYGEHDAVLQVICIAKSSAVHE